MGGIFQNQTITSRKPTTKRQAQYFKSKKDPSRGPNIKHEQNMQIEYCDWLREMFPDVHFRSDTGSGAFNSEHEKDTHNRQQSDTKLPDFTIFAMCRGYGALIFEFKTDLDALKMRRNGTKIRVKKVKVPVTRKHPTGWKITERDYKIRLKGDWASLHIEKQYQRMVELRAAGYYCDFADLERAKRITCWYFNKPYTENTSMF